jgi:hypothetical protein
MVQALVCTTGVRPIASGKPDPLIFRLAQTRVGAKRPLVIGDRLDTDLAGARNSSIPGLLVLTGVSSAADAFTARPGERPGLIARDLRALAQPHPAPLRRDGRWVAGSASAWMDGNRLVFVEGTPTDDAVPSDQLIRAAAAAAWEAADQGVQLDRESIPAEFG